MIDTGIVFQGIEPAAAAADGSFKARWHVPVDLPYFSGHFPGSPIFPAVGIVDASLQTLRVQLKNPSLNLAGIPMAKFISPIMPQQKLIVEFRPLDQTEWLAEWKEEDSLKLLASLRLRCRV